MKTWGSGYEKSKEKAKKTYSKIGRIQCSALNNEYISFSRNGFNHLIRKGRIPRPRNEQKRRFVLLQYIEQIIKNPRAVIIYREQEIKYKANRHGQKVLIKTKAKFWAFREKIDDCTIKVVIVQTNKGVKKFFSIMGDNVKISRGRKKKTKKPLKK